eukprot:5793163-Amphidinium_carterae.2
MWASHAKPFIVPGSTRLLLGASCLPPSAKAPLNCVHRQQGSMLMVLMTEHSTTLHPATPLGSLERTVDLH